MKDKLIFKLLDDPVDDYRYVCDGFTYASLWESKSESERLICLEQQYRESADKWRHICEYYIKLEDLMSYFILVDSPIDKRLTFLQDKVNHITDANLTEALKPLGEILEYTITPEDVAVNPNPQKELL